MRAGVPACVGIVDWGIGGLGVLRVLDVVAPGLPVVYWSDSGAPPYGLQDRRRLAARLRLVVGGLAERGCTEVVLACNAASTVVAELGQLPVPVEGIIGHGIASVPSTFVGTVGVVGGARTIHAGHYRRGLTAPGRVVRSRVAQPLSAHIEAGRMGSSEFVADLDRIVRPLRGAGVVVLACTHYPAAAPWFVGALPGAELVDPAERLAASVSARHRQVAGRPDRLYVTTGDRDSMRRGAGSAWSIELPRIESVTLAAG